MVEFANAGHVPPLLISRSGVQQLKSTDLVVGLFSHAAYRNQSIQLQPGDSLVLFTDGVTEAENSQEVQLGLTKVADMLKPLHCANAARLLAEIDSRVHEYIGEIPAGDDVTMLAVARCE